MSAARLVLVIDGGGTKTLGCLFENAGVPRQLAESSLGPSNPLVVGEAKSRATIADTIQAVMQDADRAGDRLDTLAIGLAGLSSSGQHEDWLRWAQEQVSANVTLVCADIGLLLHPQHEMPTIAIVSGTGSIAVGCHDGRQARCGGRGYLLGDEGSGYWIGREGLTAALRAADGRGNSTQLTDALAAHFATHDIQEWTRAVHQDRHPRRKIADLAPLVVSVADSDAVARAVLEAAAEHLAEMVHSVAHQLNVGTTFQLLMAGSILTNVPLVAQSVQVAVGSNAAARIVACPAAFAAERFATAESNASS